jgi:nitrogen regulatory protein PII
MYPIKRLEIIVSSQEMGKILEQLDQVGVQGYSVIRDVIGKSSSGRVSDDFDFASSTLSNVYILSFCEPEKVEPVMAHIRPILKKFGGVCYVSDALAQ